MLRYCFTEAWVACCRTLRPLVRETGPGPPPLQALEPRPGIPPQPGAQRARGPLGAFEKTPNQLKGWTGVLGACGSSAHVHGQPRSRQFRGLGFRGLGFRGLGFRGLGFRGLGFRGLGFRV